VAVVRFDRRPYLNAFNEKLVIELTHAAFADADQNQVTVAYQRANAARDSFQKK
jgi:hypothetical protein